MWASCLFPLAGYVGRVTEVSPICYSDPGMTNANMQFAVVEVDADVPENHDVNPELEVRSKQGVIGDALLSWHDTLQSSWIV